MTDTNLPTSSGDGEGPSERPPALPESSATAELPPPAAGARGAPDATGATGATHLWQTVLVSFNNAEEFLSELRDHPPNVDGVLRLTFRWHADESGAPLHDLWVVANYLRRLDAGALAIVRLQQYAGGVWHSVPDPESDRCRARAERLRASIQAAAEARGIEVRAGTYRTQGAASLPGADTGFEDGAHRREGAP